MSIGQKAYSPSALVRTVPFLTQGFVAGPGKRRHTRLRAAHEVPIFRLARPRRFAPDRAWGSAPVCEDGDLRK